MQSKNIQMNEFAYIQDLNTPESIQAVWEKGIVVEGYNKDLYRQDFGGAWIARDAYGDREREFFIFARQL